MKPLKFGLIGVDSSHAPTFTKILGDGVTGPVTGATINSAWKSPTTTDFPPSSDRNDDLAEQVAQLGVDLRESPEAVAEDSDALLIVASDARTHPGYFRELARFGKPIYVDTRFALTKKEAQAMLATAAEHGCLPLAGSPKRFATEFRNTAAVDGINSIELTGPLPIQPGHPVLDWYGIHLVDIAVAALDPDCQQVDASSEVVTLMWQDGRTATLGGESDWTPLTHGRIKTPTSETTFEIVAGPPMLHGLLAAIAKSCRTGVPTVPLAEVIETVSIIEAARTSRSLGSPIILR